MSGWIALLQSGGARVEASVLEDLTSGLAYRGPDARATWSDGEVGLGQALLRTTYQAEFERQPSTLDGTCHVVADARIDGRDGLRAGLGLPPTWDLDRTPDSAWILRAYARWGDDLFQHLLGDYSFALWNGRDRTLLCATDPFGLRAVYYARAGSCLAVSNSLACLQRLPGISRDLCDDAVLDFLILGDHRWVDPSLTMYEDIARLAPGHALFARDGCVDIRKVWEFPCEVPRLRDRRYGAVRERFLGTLRQAVVDRLRTSRVTVSMSGGLDSACVAALATDAVQRGDAKTSIEAVTWAYDTLPLTRERSHATAVARTLGIPIHFLAGDDYPLLDPPVATTHPLELYTPALMRDAMRRQAARSRVVLVGNAGDNLLTPTPLCESSSRPDPWTFARGLLLHRTRYGKTPMLGTGLKARWRRRAAEAPRPLPFPRWLQPDWTRSSDLEARWRARLSWRPAPINRRHPHLHAALAGPPWNVEDLFTRPGVVEPEVRDPFLDPRLLRLVLALDPLPWLPQKHILRECARGLLPATILERPKEALGVQHAALLQRPGVEWVDGWEPHEDLERYIRRDAIERLAGDASSPAVSYVGLRPLLLDLWLQNGRGGRG